jgi:hypothetical protein
METGKLFMQMQENGSMKVIFEPVGSTVWLTDSQIARLLGCFKIKVTSNIRVILKSGIFREDDICRTYKYYVATKVFSERQGVLYNLDMIIALSYRINSYKSEIFRLWLTKRICKSEQKQLDLEVFSWN